MNGLLYASRLEYCPSAVCLFLYMFLQIDLHILLISVIQYLHVGYDGLTKVCFWGMSYSVDKDWLLIRLLREWEKVEIE